jgi:steroid 5-alpha reductase family enzyme
VNVLNQWSLALAALLCFGLAGWIVSLFRRDVSIVDGMWPLMFLVAAACYAAQLEAQNARSLLVLALVTIWSIRLSAHIFWRNWGEDEDYRYQRIRENNSPHFWFKSLYIVFGLQAVLAWIISLPLLSAIGASAPLGILGVAGIALWLVGFIFESVGDYQLARFRASPASKGKVLNTGLWRFTRHPNYFGDFCVWWGFFLLALSAGGWWSIVSPLLMSFLLLKVSGVSLLERDITERRPKYAEYVARTNAFFPGPRKRA